MGRKKKHDHEKEPNHERWLVSYADFITLLFAVFVTLYAMGQTDKKKAQEVIESIQQSFGISSSSSAPAFNIIDSTGFRPIPDIPPRESPTIIKPPPPPQAPEKGGLGRAEIREFEKIKATILSFLQDKGAQDKVSLVIDPRGLVISLKEAGFFDSGSAAVRPESLPLLDNIATAIANYSNAIRIEGHTDNVPIKTSVFPSNWELSTARATSIVRYLIETRTFPPDKLSAIGYGEYRPIDDNSSAEGRQKNRRVDVVMLSREGEQGEPDKGVRKEE
ncbi:MAG: flagellar basal body stator protein MotB [Deltaproteobacteria bacterium RIFOXYD12_FULL_57_12]|nr:MAG: flagellar basal body stator protein MotB [Deltaproteobacteria bacterium RIFOXYD12_FULL_57_12]